MPCKLKKQVLYDPFHMQQHTLYNTQGHIDGACVGECVGSTYMCHNQGLSKQAAAAHQALTTHPALLKFTAPQTFYFCSRYEA